MAQFLLDTMLVTIVNEQTQTCIKATTNIHQKMECKIHFLILKGK